MGSPAFTPSLLASLDDLALKTPQRLQRSPVADANSPPPPVTYLRGGELVRERPGAWSEGFLVPCYDGIFRKLDRLEFITMLHYEIVPKTFLRVSRFKYAVSAQQRQRGALEANLATRPSQPSRGRTWLRKMKVYLRCLRALKKKKTVREKVSERVCTPHPMRVGEARARQRLAADLVGQRL